MNPVNYIIAALLPDGESVMRDKSGVRVATFSKSPSSIVIRGTSGTIIESASVRGAVLSFKGTQVTSDRSRIICRSTVVGLSANRNGTETRVTDRSGITLFVIKATTRFAVYDKAGRLIYTVD